MTDPCAYCSKPRLPRRRFCSYTCARAYWALYSGKHPDYPDQRDYPQTTPALTALAEIQSAGDQVKNVTQ